MVSMYYITFSYVYNNMHDILLHKHRHTQSMCVLGYNTYFNRDLDIFKINTTFSTKVLIIETTIYF